MTAACRSRLRRRPQRQEQLVAEGSGRALDGQPVDRERGGGERARTERQRERDRSRPRHSHPVGAHVSVVSHIAGV